MSEIGNIEQSIHHRILCILRQRKWFFQKNNVVMTKVTPTDNITYWIGKDQSWVFLTDDGQTWDSGVTVKVAGVIANRSLFRIDHVNGRVVFTSPPVGQVTVDLYINQCKVHKGYLDEETLEKSELPVVAWTIEGTTGEAFSIGTSDQDRTRYCTIEIAGRNHDEARDICEDIFRFINYLPFLEMSSHQPLDYQGEIDPAFNYVDQWVDTPSGKEVLRMPIKPRVTMLPPRAGGTDKEKHRALINFEVARVS